MSFLAIKNWAIKILEGKESGTDYYCHIRVLQHKNRNIRLKVFLIPTYQKVDYV